jgi:hypothetical protein
LTGHGIRDLVDPPHFKVGTCGALSIKHLKDDAR